MLLLYTVSFNLFKMAVQYQFSPILMFQMLFSHIEQAPGPDFRMVGKSLNIWALKRINLTLLHVNNKGGHHLPIGAVLGQKKKIGVFQVPCQKKTGSVGRLYFFFFTFFFANMLICCESLRCLCMLHVLNTICSSVLQAME